MAKDEAVFREAEQRLWKSVGVEPTERRLRLERVGVNVRVQEVGEGPTVVFVHGASVGGATWAPLMPLLDDFHCVLLDRPGCALSEPLGGAAGLADIDAVKGVADQMIPDVLDALELPTAHVAATSYGGFFAFRAAAAYPDRISRILEFSWCIGAPMAKVPLVMRIASAPGLRSIAAKLPVTAGAARMILRQVGLDGALASGRFTPEMFDWFLAVLRHTDSMQNELRSTPAVITPIRGANELMTFSGDLLAGIKMPVHFLWGEDDPNGGADVAHMFVDQFPNASLELMAGAGHAPWIDDPEHCASAARRFFSD